jgi:hypothetical protein
LAEIVNADEESKSFSTVDALNERGKLSMDESEFAVQKFIKEGWLDVNNHKYSFF